MTLAYTYDRSGWIYWAAFNPIKFSTKYDETEGTYAGRDLGLYYYGERWYHPAMGRFVNKDPSEEQGGIDLYAICGNNLANSYDTNGEGPSAPGVPSPPRPKPTQQETIIAKINAGKKILIDRYNTAFLQLKARGVQAQQVGKESCYSLNFIISGLLAPTPPYWSAVLEHRSHAPFGIEGISIPGIISQTCDHWAVVATSFYGDEMLFDAWTPRPAGENPDTWFRLYYPFPASSTLTPKAPARQLPDGTITNGLMPSDVQPYLNALP